MITNVGCKIEENIKHVVFYRGVIYVYTEALRDHMALLY